MKEINKKRLNEIIEIDLNNEDRCKVFKIVLDLIIENETVKEKQYTNIPSRIESKKNACEPPYEVTSKTTNIQYYESPVENSFQKYHNRQNYSNLVQYLSDKTL